jgi:phosphoribosylglycinamide formyltransferase 1
VAVLSSHPEARMPAVVLLSGSGSNFAAIATAARGGLPIDVRGVISDQPTAFGLERARALGIPAQVVARVLGTDRAAHDAALRAAIDAMNPALVILAGYMRIFTPLFVEHYAGRMLNIHPSLLPAYKGLNTHQRAITDGVSRHGCTVHFVTPELDGGPLIARAPVPVHADDTPTTLAERVHRVEHKLYPEVIGWYATGRLQLQDDQVSLDGKVLTAPIERIYADVQL